MIDPNLLLNSQGKYSFIICENDISEIAYTQKSVNAFNRFNIFITDRLYQMTANQKSFKYIRVGLILHEMSHAIHESFEVASPVKRLARNIYNILEDKRVEYRTQLEYPNTKLYFDMLLKHFRGIEELAIKEKVKGLTKRGITDYMEDLFNFIRYDDINLSNAEFISFLLPIENYLKTCDSFKCCELANLIYEFIKYKTGSNDSTMDNATGRRDVSISQIIKKYKEVSAIDEELKMINEIEVVEEKRSDRKVKKAISSKMLMATQNNKGMILEMSNAFKLMFEKTNISNVKEGELNINRQQEAYVNSLMGEEGYDYLERKTQYDINFDFILIRDISGSIGREGNKYFNSVISILSTLEKFKNVKTACINFNHEATVVKEFKETLRDIEIDERVWGDTIMKKALDLIETLGSTNKNKVIMILTDGETNEEKECFDILERLREEDNLVFVIHVGKGKKSNCLVDRECTFEKLTETVYYVLSEYIIKLKRRVRYG